MRHWTGGKVAASRGSPPTSTVVPSTWTTSRLGPAWIPAPLSTRSASHRYSASGYWAQRGRFVRPRADHVGNDDATEHADNAKFPWHL
eukprot:scaffold1552_cov144-Isochrysis_galbana.AAC.8